jgi:hypothetical protein
LSVVVTSNSGVQPTEQSQEEIMSSQSYRRELAQCEADAALRERIADAKLAKAAEPEVAESATPVLTAMEQFQEAIIDS